MLIAVGVLVAAAALGVAAALYIPALLGMNDEDVATKVGIETTTTTPSQSATPQSSAPEDETSDEEISDEPDSGETAPDAAADEGTDETAQDEPKKDEPPAVDKATTVRVLNATRTQGLAAGATSKLKAEGWTDLNATNYKGAAISSSVVYYKTEDDKAAAESIAETLGIGSTKLVSDLTGPLSVILAGDYRN